MDFTGKKNVGVPSVKGDVRPEEDPAVKIASTDIKEVAAETTGDTPPGEEPSDDGDATVEVRALPGAQVALGPELDRDGYPIAGTARTAKPGERFKVSKAFFEKFEGQFVEKAPAAKKAK